MKILFIGNSHTFVHYVPARVAHFCLSHGKPVETTMLTHPGMGLDWHLEQSQTYYNLLYGRYDAVVLQHNAHPFPGRESLLTAGQRIISLLPEETKPYLYMTWTEKNNPQGQETMSAAYEELGKLTGAVVCLVGRVWQAVRAAHPEEELYFADGEHSSVLGASLAGAVIGRTLLGMEVSPDLCYEDAKVLETLSMDPRMIDLAMVAEKLTMAPIGELMDQ